MSWPECRAKIRELEAEISKLRSQKRIQIKGTEKYPHAIVVFADGETWMNLYGDNRIYRCTSKQFHAIAVEGDYPKHIDFNPEQIIKLDFIE